MQVVCSSCQLNFQAPEGATGLNCPICRSPLRPAQAAAEAAAKNFLEWHGGSLDDLIAILTGPALSARVEVLPAQGDAVAGEVHVLAGGVSEAIYGGKSTYDAIDKLRAVSPARYRIEPRLPNPADGDLTYPGPDSGTLDSRPLAHLMRYCEQYVITCAIEVWRGSETARVDYRKGEISGVTVGGIDAPERLAEVMQWAAGNYRLIVPRLTLPEGVPAQVAAAAAAAATRPAAAPAPAPAPTSAPAAAQSPPPARPSNTPATRTIFGMPALDLAAMKAAEVAAAAARAQAPAPVPAPTPPSPAARTSGTMPAASPSPGMTMTPPGVPPSGVPAPIAGDRAGTATKTIFGVVAPVLPPEPQRSVRPTVVGQPTAAEPAAPSAQAAPSSAATSKIDRKTGARKTAVPAPEIKLPPGGAPASAVADAKRATQPGYDQSSSTSSPAGVASPEVALARPAPVAASGSAAAAEDRTQPVRVKPKKARGGSIVTYIGVGFLVGLALLGIFQLYGVLAH